MAWEYVGSTSGVGTATGYSVSLTGLTGGIASAPAAGDLVVVMSAFGNTASSAPNISGNSTGAYTGIGTAIHANDTWDTEAQPFYAVMGGTPDTSLSVTRTNNAAYGGSTVVHVWRGVDDLAAFIGVTQTSGNNGCVINPPAYNPAVADALIIAGGAGTMAATSSPYTDFAGMDNFVTTKGDGTTSDCAAALASYLYTGVSYDPPAISGGTTSNSSSWAGYTFAFRMFVPLPVDLLGNNVSEGNTSTDGLITQTHGLSAGDVIQANASTSGAVVQVHGLSANNVIQANLATTGVISLQADAVDLLGSSVNQANDTTAGAVNQTHILAGSSVQVAAISESGMVTQTHVPTGESSQQANTATNGAINQTHLLVGVNVVQAGALTAGAIEQSHVLAGASALHQTTSTTGNVSQEHVMTAASVEQAILSTSDAVGQTHAISGVGVVQSTVASNGAINQLHILSASDSVQANTSASGVISPTAIIELAGGVCAQINASTQGAVSQTHVLAWHPSLQPNSTSSGAIIQTHVMIGVGAQQLTTGTSGPISQSHVVSGDSVLSRSATSTGPVAQSHVLYGADATQGNSTTAGAVVVEPTPAIELAAENTAQPTTTSNGIVSQHHMLMVAAVAVDHIASASAVVQTHLLTGDYVETGWVLPGYVLSASASQANESNGGSIGLGIKLTDGQLSGARQFESSRKTTSFIKAAPMREFADKAINRDFG